MSEKQVEKKPAEKKPGFFKKVAAYFRDLKSEFKKGAAFLYGSRSGVCSSCCCDDLDRGFTHHFPVWLADLT